MALAAAPSERDDKEQVYACVMSHARGEANDAPLAKIYTSWMSGVGVLPAALGLSESAYLELMSFHFPGYACVASSHVMATMDSSRRGEVADLIHLMQHHRVGASRSEQWVASIVAAACLGRDHLWQDLGLWCRADLSALLKQNFRSLFEKNVHNMKWKRFLYKQLCETNSIYACRVPSCEYCSDYPRCFHMDEDDE